MEIAISRNTGEAWQAEITVWIIRLLPFLRPDAEIATHPPLLPLCGSGCTPGQSYDVSLSFIVKLLQPIALRQLKALDKKA